MLLFKSLKRPPKFTLTINGYIIEQVKELFFLCITVDQNVTWDAHITKILIKLARVIGILHKLKRIFPQDILYLRAPPLRIKMQTHKNIVKEGCKDSRF